MHPFSSSASSTSVSTSMRFSSLETIRHILRTLCHRSPQKTSIYYRMKNGCSKYIIGDHMKLVDKTVLVTGANRGIGQALVQEAVGKVDSLDILVNNAGVALYDDLSDRAVLEQHLAVNLFGTYGVTQAFLPLLIRSGGAIVNNVSMMALAPFPITPAYSISKA